MRIAISSASNAVTRVLEAIIDAAGHHHVKPSEEADLVIEDALHPDRAVRGDARLLLTAGAQGETSIPCPVRPEALIQRLTIHAAIQTITLGHGWSLDMKARTLHHLEQPHLPLTEKECSVLRYLAQHPEPLTREDLLEKIWGVDDSIDTHTIETHIYRLRAKLEGITPSPGNIVTDAGAYRFMV